MRHVLAFFVCFDGNVDLLSHIKKAALKVHNFVGKLNVKTGRT